MDVIGSGSCLVVGHHVSGAVVVNYGCDTWSGALMKEHRLMVFEKNDKPKDDNVT
jgi:hypothetical protein